MRKILCINCQLKWVCGNTLQRKTDFLTDGYCIFLYSCLARLNISILILRTTKCYSSFAYLCILWSSNWAIFCNTSNQAIFCNTFNLSRCSQPNLVLVSIDRYWSLLFQPKWVQSAKPSRRYHVIKHDGPENCDFSVYNKSNFNTSHVYRRILNVIHP